jgi:radical SAM superfamily enzyme YgiQ (UPF0313 family)
MRAPGDVLLLSCYELGHQPWNLASPLAYLQQAGYSPVAVDTSVEALTDEAIRRARLVALSVPMHTALRLGVQVAERVRRVNPSAHVTFYGLYAWLNKDYLLPAFGDTIIAGEYEQPLLGLAHALEHGEPAWTVPGVADADHQTEPYRERLPFVVPQRASLPSLDHYAHFREGDTLTLAGYVEASRGCLHTCLHCPLTPIYGGRFFVVPRDVVLADIRAQVAAGARHITFGDPDFLNGPGHVLKIVSALHEEFPTLTWDATIKIEHILEQRTLLPELRRLGCAFIVSAVESFSDHVLAHLDKGHTAADIDEAFALTESAGIPLRASFVAFTPWTRLDDYIEMLHQIEMHGMVEQVDPVQYTIRLLIPPGSALLGQPDTREWLGELDAAAFTYRWSHPDPCVDDLYRAVSALVEEAVARSEPTSQTFYRVRALAYDLAGREPTVFEMVPPLSQRVVPGLTEAWFC